MKIQELRALVQTKNNGRGVSSVTGVLDYLGMGMRAEAIQFCQTDNDKISNFPDLKLALFNLLPEYEREENEIARKMGWEAPRLALLKELKPNIEIE